VVVTKPEILESSTYLLYVIWPAFYTASGTLALTSYLEDAQHRRREQALRDPLTRLLNRRGFDEHWPTVMAYAARQKLPVTLIALDIDHFKRINDRFGHATGDLVLCATADRLRRELRQVDLSARFGGEEFLVLLSYADLATGIACAERMRAAMQDCVIAVNAGEVRFSASFGVATAPGSGDFEDLYRRADAALYRAKATGRNRVEAEHGLAA
jgi:diguanylate cyclase (GGDEF)-like protein